AAGASVSTMSVASWAFGQEIGWLWFMVGSHFRVVALVWPAVRLCPFLQNNRQNPGPGCADFVDLSFSRGGSPHRPGFIREPGRTGLDRHAPPPVCCARFGRGVGHRRVRWLGPHGPG